MTKKPCPICGRSISASGLAQTSHMRAHCRRKEARCEDHSRVEGGRYITDIRWIPLSAVRA